MSTHDAIHTLLAEVGISCSGYTAAELNELLADGVAFKHEPTPLKDARKLEAAHRWMLREHHLRSAAEARVLRVGWPGGKSSANESAENK